MNNPHTPEGREIDAVLFTAKRQIHYFRTVLEQLEQAIDKTSAAVEAMEARFQAQTAGLAAVAGEQVEMFNTGTAGPIETYVNAWLKRLTGYERQQEAIGVIGTRPELLARLKEGLGEPLRRWNNLYGTAYENQEVWDQAARHAHKAVQTLPSGGVYELQLTGKVGVEPEYIGVIYFRLAVAQQGFVSTVRARGSYTGRIQIMPKKLQELELTS